MNVIASGRARAGSAVAALLAKEGKKVLIVDKKHCSAGGRMATIHDKGRLPL
jgi:phytoene dehydrogenase-like protein